MFAPIFAFLFLQIVTKLKLVSLRVGAENPAYVTDYKKYDSSPLMDRLCANM